MRLIDQGTARYPRGRSEPSLSEKTEATPLILDHDPREAPTLSPSLVVWESAACEYREPSAFRKKRLPSPRLLDHADG